MAVSRSLGNLIVRLVAEGLGGYKADMNAAADVTKDAANKIETSTSKAGKAAQVMGGQIGAFATQAEALGAVAGAAGLGVTALAAGIAVAGYAAFQGAKEAKAYELALIMTGNAVGVTRGQMAGMAADISKVVGTQGQASAALIAMANTGAVAGENLQKFTQTAIEMERTVGQKVADTAKIFEQLGDAPVKASIKLNESLNYLTVSTYEQIKAATELGDKENAASIAQNAYADAVAKRTASVEANLGTLQKAWRSVGEMAKLAWDKMMNLGRETGPEQALATQRTAVENLEKQLARGGTGTGGIQRQLDAARQAMGTMQEEVKLGQKSAQAQAYAAASTKAKISWMQEGDKYQSKEEKLAQTINRIRFEGNAAGASAVEIEKRINAEKEKGVKSGGRGGASAEKISEYTRMAEAIGKVTAMQEQELANGGKLTASVKYQFEELQKINFALQTKKISTAESIRLIDMTTIATAKMVEVAKQAANIKSNVASYADQIQFNKEIFDAEEMVRQGRQQSVEVLREYSKAVEADNEFTAFELSLLGETEEAKKKAIALFRVEIELRKQLETIKKNMPYDAEGQAQASAAAYATAASAKAGVTSRIQLEAAGKAQQEQIDLWKQIDSTAESVFMNVYQNGSKAFKGIADDLKNTLGKALYELTLKPFIVQMATSFSGKDAGGALGGSGGNSLHSFLKGMSGGSGSGSQSLGSSDFGGRADDSAMALDGVGDSLDKLGAASGLSVASLIAQTIATINMGLAALAAAAQMAIAFVIANPVASFFIAVGAAIAAIFSFGAKEAPNVLNDLDLFNKSLAGLPFQDIAYAGDEAAQGLRDVLYGLENATPAMRKLAGDTIALTGDLMRASGDIAGAKAYDRNVQSRGMSEAELALYDYNQGLRDQIEAARAGAAAASAAASAENNLASQRFTLSNKLNVLLGRQTQLQADRAAQLAGVTDAAVLSLLNMTFQMEDLHSAVDANYAKLERSIAAEKKLVDVRLKSATDLASALKTTRDAISPTLDRATAQSQIAMYLALAKAGGVLPSAAALKPALDAIAKPSVDLFTTFEEYAIDQARTANDIGDLAGYADKQVSMEQQTLDRLDGTLEAAKAQIDLLKGIDNSVTSVASAVTAFQFSMEALAAAKSTAGSYNYASPMTGGGGGGGYSGGGAAGAAAGGAYEAIAGQDNADIVAAYRTYYSRNPDASGYDFFSKSNLAGDALMQAILRASSGDANGADYQKAIANGYDPMNPIAKYLKSKNKSSAATVEDFGSFASGGDHTGGLRLVGELGPELEATGASRISSTNTLLDAFRSGGKNSDALVQEIRELRKEVARLAAAGAATAANTGQMARTLDDVTSESGGTAISMQAAEVVA